MKRLEQLNKAMRKTFARGEGYLAAALGAFFVVVLTVALPNLKLLRFVFDESEFSIGLKLRTAAEVLWNGRIVFTHEGGWVALPLAVVFGLNAALVTRYMRDQVNVNHAAGVSAVGILIGLLGIGCVACGSIVLTSLLGLGIVAALPFGGQEFAWIGLVVTAAATFNIAAKIAEPAVCKIQRPD